MLCLALAEATKQTGPTIPDVLTQMQMRKRTYQGRVPINVPINWFY